MKINWGHKLVFFTVSFMLFVVFMVYKISTQKVDLVDKNYYEKGVRYQDEINKYTASASVKHSIDVSLSNQLITFKADNPNLTGTVYFYRAADENMDFKEPFALKDSVFTYSIAKLNKGIWHVTFEWTLDGKLMAAEKQFVME